MKRFLMVFVLIGLAISLMAINDFAKERKNFRIKPLWQPANVLYQSDFDPDQYNLFGNWRLGEWFGIWWWYALIQDYGYVGTDGPILFEMGDIVPLRQMRRVNGSGVNRNLGIEAEVRAWKDLWFGANYLQSPVHNINTLEEEDLVMFPEFIEIFSDPENNYYEYFFRTSRATTIRTTKERFSSTNFQIFAKYEIGTDLIQLFGGVGFDFWRLKRTIDGDLATYSIEMETNRVISGVQEKLEQRVETEWYKRPFALVGLQVNVLKNLTLGGEAKVFKSQTFQYQRPFRIYYGNTYSAGVQLPILHPGFWVFRLNASSLSLYLAFSF